jgi:hypothetical protein
MSSWSKKSKMNTAMKTDTPQPMFMKAIEIFGKQEISVRKVETTPSNTRPPWLVNENETIDLTMCAIPKGATRERIQAEFTSNIYGWIADGRRGWIRHHYK